MSDIERVFWTVLLRMASRVFVFLAPSDSSLVRNWFVCKEPRTPDVKLVWEAFQPLFRWLRWLMKPIWELWCERCLLITESPRTPGHYSYLIWVLGYIPYTGSTRLSFTHAHYIYMDLHVFLTLTHTTYKCNCTCFLYLLTLYIHIDLHVFLTLHHTKTCKICSCFLHSPIRARVRSLATSTSTNVCQSI